MMGPSLRRAVLAVHITVSVGWIGSVLAYLALDVTTATRADAAILRAAYVGMDTITTWAIVPLALAALVSGILLAAGTRWGLARHYWVVASLGLTIVAVVVLLAETRVIGALAAQAVDPETTAQELRGLPSTLPHSVGGLVVLLVVHVLNIYKPPGVTPYGWRRMQQEQQSGG